jgi:hypothetical protein
MNFCLFFQDRKKRRNKERKYMVDMGNVGFWAVRKLGAHNLYFSIVHL